MPTMMQGISPPPEVPHVRPVARRPCISVLIATHDRAAVLHDTVANLRRQSFRPAEIIVVVSDRSHVLDATTRLDGVRVVLSDRGLCVQRNAAIRAVRAGCDLMVFLDDDVELHPFYLREMHDLFQADPALVLATGLVLADGAKTSGIPRLEAERIIQDAHSEPSTGDVSPTWTTYGCNMAVRSSVTKHVQFDERLPLYAWLEDLDFAASCSRFGKVVKNGTAQVVHLGTKSGRVSERRVGFSQIMNSYYIARKSNLTYKKMFLFYWAKPFLSNLTMSLLPQRHMDRRERLIGNLKAVVAILQGRCAPEDVLRV